ncbi:MAG TPA: polyamine ABC transporter ATP-binding protein [Bacteroidetes bacterium]|nr:polyamine ABC transporter ATP-binding protein [Bacteroidota bacterium]
MQDEIAIKVSNLSKRYGENLILENINLEIKRGSIVCIAGGSGSGKSTLLRQIIGLEEPTSGEIYIEDQKFYPSKSKESERIKKSFGVMFQMGGLIASMTLRENIELLLRTYTNLTDAQMAEIVRIKLTSVGLQGFEDFIPSEISGGMKKRASLARAMTIDPEILFFDEPSSGLDPITASSLDYLIKQLNKTLKTTMVIVTHDLESIFDIADEVFLLDTQSHTIIANGKPDVLKKSDIQIVYNFFNRKF